MLKRLRYETNANRFSFEIYSEHGMFLFVLVRLQTAYDWLALTVGLFLLQEFADYFERQLQTNKYKTEDGEDDKHSDTDATDTNLDPFAEIIWKRKQSRANEVLRNSNSEVTGTGQAHNILWEISAGATQHNIYSTLTSWRHRQRLEKRFYTRILGHATFARPTLEKFCNSLLSNGRERSCVFSIIWIT